MSTEQDKDTFSIERHRGGDGGLEALGGLNVMLTSPDKKECKSETPSFSTLTEYAPPPNPSTDRLVAANPFDDSYSPSFKPLSVGNPYLSPSQYPGLGSYGPPRMATVMSGRMLSPCGLYQVCSQLHPYPQNQEGFNLPPGSTYRHQENSAFRNQSLFCIKYNNMSLPPNQFVRPGVGNTIKQVLQQYGVHTPPTQVPVQALRSIPVGILLSEPTLVPMWASHTRRAASLCPTPAPLNQKWGMLLAERHPRTHLHGNLAKSQRKQVAGTVISSLGTEALQLVRKSKGRSSMASPQQVTSVTPVTLVTMPQRSLSRLAGAYSKPIQRRT